jgi:drug/metabolite transporter (DMT)-like permease
MPRSHPTLGLFLGLAAVLIFGGSLPATRLAVAGLDPWFVTAGRAAIGGTVAVVMLAAERPRFPRAKAGILVLISLCLVIGSPAFIALASRSVPAAHGGVILGILPLATAIAAVPLAGERPSAWFWMLSLAGAGLVAAFALREGNVSLITGDLFLAAAVTLTGIGYTLSALLARAMPGRTVIAWALLISLPITLAGCVVLWPGNAAAVAPSAWAGLVYGGVMSQFIGYALWNAALAAGGVARIGQLQLLQPFVTIALAAIFLSETVDAAMIGFAIAVALVVMLGRRAVIRDSVRPAAE